MTIVDRPTLAPGMCMFLKKGDMPCFDLLNDFDFDHDGRMYVSVSWVEDRARELGLVRADVQEAVVAELEGRIASLQVELEEERRYTAAIDVMESKGFTARKKPGRPKTAAKEAAHA